MRVAVVHNSYKERGGEDAVFETEVDALRSSGVDVLVHRFSNEAIDRSNVVGTALSSVWNFQLSRELAEEFHRFSPDVVHVHNTMPIVSPAVFHVAKQAGAVTVSTLHNYRLLCPAANLYRSGRVCEDCVGKLLAWPGILHGCYRGSRAATATVAGTVMAHRLLGTYAHKVDLFVALTDFAKQTFVRGGVPADHIVVKPNFLPQDPGLGDGSGDYVLFVGRLSHEKGILTLLEAWRGIGERVPLHIVGDGPLSTVVARAAATMSGVSVLGRLSPSDVLSQMKRARYLVVPSELYETFGLVTIEAYATGLPVLASRLGALEEIVIDGSTGMHFEPSNADDLRAKVLALDARSYTLVAMRRHAREEFERRYGPEAGLRRLLDVYELALAHPRHPRSVKAQCRPQ